MGENMTTKNYIMIQENNIINIIVWDGNTTTWQPPQDVLVLPQDTTPTKIWRVSTEINDYVLTESVGEANIGFTWDGSFAITNAEKPTFIQEPADDQPENEGLQEL